MAQLVEIDHRANGGIDVSLMWDRSTDVLYVQVIDWGMDEDYTFAVDRDHALDAFRHPFAYADRPGSWQPGWRRRPPVPKAQAGSR